MTRPSFSRKLVLFVCVMLAREAVGAAQTRECPPGLIARGNACVKIDLVLGGTGAQRYGRHWERPYDGGRVRAYWHAETKGKGLIIGGFLTFGVAYTSAVFSAAIWALAGAIVDSPSHSSGPVCASGYLLVPVVGGFISASVGTTPGCSANKDMLIPGAIFSTVQVAGLAIGLIGLATKQKVLVYDGESPPEDASSETKEKQPAIRFSLRPSLSGLTLVASF
jgi:hypothetical protein